jgi:hypothetical protein
MFWPAAVCVSIAAKAQEHDPWFEAKPVLRDHRAHGLNLVVSEPEHDQIHGADGLTVWERGSFGEVDDPDDSTI